MNDNVEELLVHTDWAVDVVSGRGAHESVGRFREICAWPVQEDDQWHVVPVATSSSEDFPEKHAEAENGILMLKEAPEQTFARPP